MSYTLHVRAGEKAGGKGRETTAYWEWSRKDFWNHLKWDDEDYFWYSPFKDKSKTKIIKFEDEYTRYTAWGQRKQGKHGKHEVEIEHGRGKMEEEE